MTYPFGDYVEPPGPIERTAGRWREAPADGNKFQLVKWPPLPGKCASCGYSGGNDNLTSDYERMFIDLSFDVDFYGTVVFCSACVIEMGSVLGFVPPETHQNVVSIVSELSAKNQELSLANDQLRNVVHTLTSDSRLALVSVASVTATGPNADEIIGTESEPDAPVSVERRNFVSSDSGRRDNYDGLDI